MPRAICRFWLLSLFLLASSSACRPRASFRVLAGSPDYFLLSPDSTKTPFPGILHSFNGFEPGRSWIDLRPLMELRIENAYYEKGASRRGLAGFLGTEVAHFEITPQGLRLLSVQPMAARPDGDIAVQLLIPKPALQFRYYRLYFELVFARSADAHGSALLGADSPREMEQLSAQLTRPETVCSSASVHCTVFPEACSVSIEMRIVVNGKPRTVVWGSRLASVVTRPQAQRLDVKRIYSGRLTPLKLDSKDDDALRLPLLPGDEIAWR